MTDEQIIKAVNYCADIEKNEDCEKCPIKEVCHNEAERLIVKVADLLNRQKAENSELVGKIDKLEVEIERLQHILLNFMNEAEKWERKYGVDIENIPQIAILSTVEKRVMKRIKTKATQEIAKTIDNEIKNAIENNLTVKRDYQDKENIINDEFVMYCDGKLHALYGINDFIDNLVKEMTEVKE